MTKTHVPIRNVQYFSHDHIIIVSSQVVSNAQFIIDTLDHCHRLIAGSVRAMPEVGRATSTRLSAPVRGRRLSPTRIVPSAVIRRWKPGGDIWLLWFTLFGQGSDARSSCSSLLSPLNFFDAIAFWNVGVPSFQYSFLPYFSSLLLLFLLFFSQ